MVLNVLEEEIVLVEARSGSESETCSGRARKRGAADAYIDFTFHGKCIFCADDSFIKGSCGHG